MEGWRRPALSNINHEVTTMQWTHDLHGTTGDSARRGVASAGGAWCTRARAARRDAALLCHDALHGLALRALPRRRKVRARRGHLQGPRAHTCFFGRSKPASGALGAAKNKRGSYNLLKPNYSSFKLGGIQIRGKNAATFQLIYMLIILCVNFVKIFWHIFTSILWFGFLILKWFIDFLIGFFKGFKGV